MAIDPKKIAEWKARAEAATHGTPAWDDLAPVDADFLRAAREAVPALLSDREEMLAAVRAFVEHRCDAYRMGGSCVHRDDLEARLDALLRGKP